MQKISPFLWFDDQAEEAVRFYKSIFKNSKIKTIARWPKGSPGPVGKVMMIEFSLAGQSFLALNGGPQFKFTEAISLMVECKTQREIDHYWEKLSKGGKKVACGWLKDKYGLFWQITPSEINRFYTSQDPEKAARVMQAMIKMVKLDIKKLKAAYDGKPAKRKSKQPQPRQP